jgi:hypothetical protein
VLVALPMLASDPATRAHLLPIVLYFILSTLSFADVPEAVAAKTLQSLKAVLTMQPDLKYLSAFCTSLATVGTTTSQTGLVLVLTMHPTLLTPSLIKHVTSFQHLQVLYLTAMSTSVGPILTTRLAQHMVTQPSSAIMPFLLRFLASIPVEKRSAILLLALPIVTRKMTQAEAPLVVNLLESFGAEMRDVIRALETVDGATVQKLMAFAQLGMQSRSSVAATTAATVAKPVETIQLKTNFAFPS